MTTVVPEVERSHKRRVRRRRRTAYDVNAMLTVDELCEALGDISEELLNQLDLPLIPIGKRKQIGHWGTIVNTLKGRASGL